VALSRRQAVEIRDGRFDDDVKVLVQALQEIHGIAGGGRRRKRIWVLLAAVCLALIAATILWRGRAAPDSPKLRLFDIAGTWVAEMQKPGQRVFRVKLDLSGTGGQLIGTVEYPTGTATIQAGKFENGSLSFFTIHTPDFASEPATIHWTGVIEGEGLRLTEADANGVAKGIARRK